MKMQRERSTPSTPSGRNRPAWPAEPLREQVVVVPAPHEVPGLVCGIWRELSGDGEARADVPANVYGCLNHVAAGSVRLANGTSLPGSFLTGPMTRPLATRARAPLRSASVVFEPWLMEVWFGIPLASTVDHWLAADRAANGSPALQVLTPDAAKSPRALADAMRRCADLPVAQEDLRLAAALEREGSVSGAARLSALSERQFERRFKIRFGLTPRRWLAVRRR